MTLRDYFAAKAMQAIITKPPVVDREGEFGGGPVEDKIKYNADIANSAYWIADAMLEERAQMSINSDAADILESAAFVIGTGHHAKGTFWDGYGVCSGAMGSANIELCGNDDAHAVA